ncbi:fatty acid desaturase [Francisella adeliensis]|uniref:Acyl-CoA desaturase n=1 Tax=Francisella adeliensis TaxID=2007306 RepID=A0A2Z4XWS1_9GAMM|nr:fatty acid desaturase [Francisella adeliensis]AXA33327.1 fatty acid desaturase [Francisella adeliensis]MBK2085337.1 fatty acid desaturase [Francisella adeliensis]MBK2097067.1 fatty acid desaturase [Francisella adeliensis]QIW11556.1 acyl-CoA desaturase [Francisella adeliensis]QIW13430.1 acyl-CoA desaturase [Francisella adeliensis]
MNNEIINQEIEKEGSIVWKSIVGLLILPIVALVVVPWFAYSVGFTKADYMCLLAFYILTGISITMGYHRLWSHKTYKANKIVSYILLVFGTAALQNSVLQWASDHRKHHKDVDDPIKDPYAATRGFWYSHFTWLFKYNNADVQEIRGVNDLLKDKAVVFQHQHYTILATLTCLGLPALAGFIYGFASEGTLSAALWRTLSFVLLGGLVRVILVHHATFCINSLAHILGRQPYNTKNTARDSFITALVTGGEGYHNYHHAFAGDYRNGIRWFDFDPSKWLIAGLAKIGWCTDLKRTPKHLIEIAKARVKLDEALLRKTKTSHFGIEEKYAKLVANVKSMYSAKQEYVKAKKDNVLSKADIKAIKSKYKDLKIEFIDAKKKYKASIVA